MSDAEITERVRHFIFDHINSVEQLEVLLLLRQHSNQPWDAKSISQELRSSPISVTSRLESLERIGLLKNEEGRYIYQPANDNLKKVIDELNDVYKIKRQKIFELIFSPMKKAKDFADAFKIGKTPKKGDT